MMVILDIMAMKDDNQNEDDDDFAFLPKNEYDGSDNDDGDMIDDLDNNNDGRW